MTIKLDFNGQPITELDQNGNWTDYIYANGTNITRVAENVPMLHFSGTNPQSGVECGALVDVGLNYSVQAGDMLSWMEYKNNAVGGLAEFFNGGALANPWRATDTNGITINQDSRQGMWVPRTYDLSAYAGTSLTALTTLKDVNTPAGSWDIWYTDIAIVSTNGAVTTVMGSTGQVAAYGAECQGPYSAVNIALETVVETPGMAPAIVGTGVDTHFYSGDHLGSAQMELASGGWPVWATQFAPFGGEIQNGAAVHPDQPDGSANNYKFTGKERDAESGLDYFGARYYGSSMGRFMSPDPLGIASGNLSNPQSFNLYSYVLNNPLVSTDPSGMECVWDDGSYDDNDDSDTGLKADGSHPGCEGAGGNWVDHSYFAGTGMPDWSPNANSNLTCGGISTPTPASPGLIDYAATAQGNAAAYQQSPLSWYGAFKGNGTQDFKNTTNFPQSAYGDGGNRQTVGNFNFGASVAATGKSLSFGQFWAGMGAYQSNVPAMQNNMALGMVQAGYADGGYGRYTGGEQIPLNVGLGVPGFPAMGPDGVMNQGDQTGPTESVAVATGYLWQSLGCKQ